MELGELNKRVTSAIFRAEHLPTGSLEAIAAFREVSELENQIARCTAPDSVEGTLARRGAVIAAMNAEIWLDASRLVEAYLIDPAMPATLADELRALRNVADAELSKRGAADVKQIRFALHDAA